MAPNLGDKYVKLSPIDHVLLRSSMYIGSIEPDNYELWLLNAEGDKMEKKTIKFIAGFFKIFDEVIANASDHYNRLKDSDEKDIILMKNIKVSISKETGIISVFNDGMGVDVAEHPEHNMYIPQLIFGNLMTSTNYDDTKDRSGVGQNGYGIKLCNIFSEFFEVETVDSVRKLLYKQRFTDNMSVTNEPTIETYTKKPYTIITFKPDYKRFGGHLTDDMYEVIRKRTYDLCAITDKDMNVYFNDVKIEYKTFQNYVDLYIGSKSEHTRVHEVINNKWEVIASYNEFNGFEQISFVNGLLTIKGGKHIEYITNQIVKKMTELLNKKIKNMTIKPQSIKDNMILFLKCTVSNPTFDSQSKETLTTPAAKFGTKPEISDKFILNLYKTGIVEKIIEICAIQGEKTLKKTDGKKRDVIRGLPKLEDANWAGTAKSKECLLLLTEGDSGASMAISGLAEIGRDKYGVFPLKGKVMNVKDISIDKIANNDEITNIKKILGLESGKKYTDASELRYGGIMLMTDADVDGLHISGLIFNLFHTLWPTILKDFKFIHSLSTPIVKVKRRLEVISFYTLTEYENWKLANDDGNGWDTKYFKGLATSTSDEAVQYFKDMKKVTYKFTENSDQSIELAFNKKKADDRKEWLSKYDRQNILDSNDCEVSYEDFVNKGLIHFSNYDVQRSIPSMIDGLKISQRKIMFACFKRNLTDKEIRVAQLASYVSEQAAYHHGEASLQGAIVNMAQDYVGSNNINLLKPNGMFGGRYMMGKDAGQPRYIHTLLSEITTCIFNKQDCSVLTYLDDDGLSIEPEHYIPIIPMILVNGSIGIGTGFSTNIPSYNPTDIVNLLKRLLMGEEVDSEEDDLLPWYKGFKGTIKKIDKKIYSIGIFKKISATKIEVTELPIGYATFDFKADLETALDKLHDFKKYENSSSGDIVNFVLHFTNASTAERYMEIESNGFSKFENDFKLVTTKGLNTSNMYAFNEKGAITKYESPFDIINQFYDVRMNYYKKRKQYLLAKLQYDADLMANKIRFIKEVVSETIVVHKMKKAGLETYLEENDYMKHGDVKHGDAEKKGADGNYDYITRIPVYNLTTDKVEELENDIVKANESISQLSDKTTEAIWLDELKDFEKAYDKCMIKKIKQTKRK